jgi:uncharacterized protein (TIGR03086 family)
LIVSEVSERYRKVAASFTQRVEAVPDEAWDSPSPCEGWTARDVVRHLTDWVPGFFTRWDLECPSRPSVDRDPLGAWVVVRDFVQGALDDPETAAREAESPMGRTSVERSVGMIVVGDVLIHTWDLSRATGQDETLDPDEVQRLSGMMQMMSSEILRSGGQFGPEVTVPENSEPQTKLLAFSGRQP